MRRIWTACLVGVALLAAAPREVSAQEVIDRVLAVAGGDVITLSDVRASIELGRVTTGSTADPVRAGLTLLIDRALILDEVDRFAPPEPSSEAVDAAVAEAAARVGSPAMFDQVLARYGLDRPFVRELVRQDLRIRAYLDQRFTADTPAQQRQLVDAWVAGVRQRADVLDLYADTPAPR
jgi:hypothetical protein